jgi:HEAT repeat protein
MADIEALLQVIQRDLIVPSKETIAAAEVLRAEVRAGADLSEQVRALISCCQQCSQVPLLSPLSITLILQALRAGDDALLDRLMGSSKFRFGLHLALSDAVTAGLPTAPLIAALLRQDPEGCRSVLGVHFKAHPELVDSLQEVIEQEPDLRVHLPRLLIELTLWSRVPISPMIPTVVEFLQPDEPKTRREEAARIARQIAEQGWLADLARLRPALLAALSDPAADVRWPCALALALGGEDGLERHRDPQVRRGALMARGQQKRADPLAEALLDPEPEVHQLALRILEGLHHPAAAEAILQRLARSPEDGPGRYLRALAEADAGLAERLRGWLAEGSLLMALLGTGMPLCGLCRHLPRSQDTTRRDSFPERIAQLEPPLTFDRDDRLTRCPECGWRYRYSWYQEDRGLYPEDSYTLARLSPEDAAYEADREPLLDRLRADLHHLEPKARIEAAWGLSRWRETQGDTEGLLALIHHADPEVRQEAMRSLRQPPSPSVRLALQEHLTDPTAAAREAAATRLADQELPRLLTSDDPPLLLAGLRHLWQHAPEKLAEHAPRCIELLAHEDSGVRRTVSWAMEAGLKVAAVDVRPLLGLLDHPRPDTRSRALRLLAAGVKQQPMALQPWLPRLGELLADPETAGGASTLLTAVARDLDLSLLLDLIAENIAGGRHLQTSFALLSAALSGPTDRGGIARAYGVGLAGSWSTTAAGALLKLAQAGDVSAAMPQIEAGLHSDETYTRDQCARAAIRQALREGDRAALGRLLQDPTLDIGVSALSELAASGQAPDGLTDAIAAFLSRPESWVRRYAGDVLTRLPDAVGARAAVEAQPESPERERLLSALPHQ